MCGYGCQPGPATASGAPGPRTWGLSQWEESNELNFVASGLAGDVQFLAASADFIPHMSAVGARQHPQKGSCSAASAAGVSVVAEVTAPNTSSDQPGSGLLWPRLNKQGQFKYQRLSRAGILGPSQSIQLGENRLVYCGNFSESKVLSWPNRERGASYWIARYL